MKELGDLKRETKSDLEDARRRRLDRENPLGAALRDLEAAERDGSAYKPRTPEQMKAAAEARRAKAIAKIEEAERVQGEAPQLDLFGGEP